jgi:hypothetical protein
MALLFVLMAVAGTMECKDAEEVDQFSKEWRVFPVDDGGILWVRVGGQSNGSHRDTMQLVQSQKLSAKH